MTYVYVVMCSDMDEGSYIRGVFSKGEEAVKCGDRVTEEDKYVCVDIYKWEIDEGEKP